MIFGNVSIREAAEFLSAVRIALVLDIRERLEGQSSLFPLFDCSGGDVQEPLERRRRTRQIKTIDFLNKFIFYFRKLRRSKLFTLFLMPFRKQGTRSSRPIQATGDIAGNENKVSSYKEGSEKGRLPTNSLSRRRSSSATS